MKGKNLLFLLLLTCGALFIHGYHPWAEDAEIYVPGIEKLLHPELFPFNAQFFAAHAHSTLFPNLIASSVRLSHLSLETALFLWHLASIFLFLLACWELSGRCFADARARWAGVALIAALLTLPVAGTALYLMDQYVNPRNLSAFAAIFALVRVLDRKYLQAAGFLLLAATIHPLMSMFAISYCFLVAGLQESKFFSSLAAWLPFGLSLAPPPKAYHQVALTHPYHYLSRWQWYEWLGALAPLVILWWFSQLARARRLRTVDLLCRALVIYELVYLPLALLLSIPPRFEALARLQPMRCLYLLYIIMFLVAAGLLTEYLLKDRLWGWIVLLLPLSLGMFTAQRSIFPASAHLEWPGSHPRNPWVAAFLWVREHTPTTAIFALNPHFMDLKREDAQGFRAVAERSRMADAIKDAGVVSMFPELADEWWRQVQAQSEWNQFQIQDLRRLESEYGVSWVIVEQPGVRGLDCPYQNDAVKICQLN
ncbi:MAG TPA: hypothetical protein VMH03_18245 [Terriglobales bacterium]|nr:hypothetical protein [Terriglobales bacterium]